MVDVDFGRKTETLEVVVAFAKILPEIEPLAFRLPRHSFVIHAEGKKVDAKEWLATVEGGGAEGVDFLDPLIGHGKASDRDPVAVDHDVAAGPTMVAIVGVGVADVEGEVKTAVGLHCRGRDVVEAFGHLAISFGEFRSRSTRKRGDAPGAEMLVSSTGTLEDPEFEQGFFFEGAEEDGVAEAQVFCGEGAFQFRAGPLSGGPGASGSGEGCGGIDPAAFLFAATGGKQAGEEGQEEKNRSAWAHRDRSVAWAIETVAQGIVNSP